MDGSSRVGACSTMAMPEQPVAPRGGEIVYEAAPDVEVFLRIMREGNLVNELEANINISRTALELKQSLSEKLEIPVQFMELYKDTVRFDDGTILLDYDIVTDTILTLVDTSPAEGRRDLIA